MHTIYYREATRVELIEQLKIDKKHEMERSDQMLVVIQKVRIFYGLAAHVCACIIFCRKYLTPVYRNNSFRPS